MAITCIVFEPFLSSLTKLIENYPMFYTAIFIKWHMYSGRNTFYPGRITHFDLGYFLIVHKLYFEINLLPSGYSYFFLISLVLDNALPWFTHVLDCLDWGYGNKGRHTQKIWNQIGCVVPICGSEGQNI